MTAGLSEIFYKLVRIMHPVPPRTAKPGVNVHALVITTFPREYQAWELYDLDWDDLNLVLDYLYGTQSLCDIDTSKVIQLIEDNSEVH